MASTQARATVEGGGPGGAALPRQPGALAGHGAGGRWIPKIAGSKGFRSYADCYLQRQRESSEWAPGFLYSMKETMNHNIVSVVQ